MTDTATGRSYELNFDIGRQALPLPPESRKPDADSHHENPVDQDRVSRFTQDPNVNTGGVSNGSD